MDHRARPLRLARHVALAWLLVAATAMAAEPASLEVSWSAGETSWLVLERIRVLVDGAEVQAALPPAGAATGATVFRGPIAAGARTVEVEAALRGDSRVFTYVEGYRYLVRGRLPIQVTDGDRISVEARGVAVPGVTVPWEDRYRLALSARVEHAPGALEAALAAAAAEPPAPEPAAARPAPAPAPACALDQVRFAFDSAALTPAAKEALGRFAACMAGRGGRVDFTGFWDSRGPLAYNVGLGERRARAAAAFLVASGLPAASVQVVRATSPVYLCTAQTRACHAQNRRVEARVLP